MTIPSPPVLKWVAGIIGGLVTSVLLAAIIYILSGIHNLQIRGAVTKNQHIQIFAALDERKEAHAIMMGILSGYFEDTAELKERLAVAEIRIRVLTKALEEFRSSSAREPER